MDTESLLEVASMDIKYLEAQIDTLRNMMKRTTEAVPLEDYIRLHYCNDKVEFADTIKVGVTWVQTMCRERYMVIEGKIYSCSNVLSLKLQNIEKG